MDREDGKDSGNESTAPERSAGSESSSKPVSTTEPTTQPSEPANTPSTLGELQTETPENKESRPMPEAPSVTEVSTPLQPESEPGLELEPGGSDIIIQDSGDILLPEAP